MTILLATEFEGFHSVRMYLEITHILNGASEVVLLEQSPKGFLGLVLYNTRRIHRHQFLQLRAKLASLRKEIRKQH